MVYFGSTINRQNQSEVFKSPGVRSYRGFFYTASLEVLARQKLFSDVIFFQTEKSINQVISISDRYEAENPLAIRRKNLVANKQKGGVIHNRRIPHGSDLP